MDTEQPYIMTIGSERPLYPDTNMENKMNIAFGA